jgi:hypothetical protein
MAKKARFIAGKTYARMDRKQEQRMKGPKLLWDEWLANAAASHPPHR